MLHIDCHHLLVFTDYKYDLRYFKIENIVRCQSSSYGMTVLNINKTNIL